MTTKTKPAVTRTFTNNFHGTEARVRVRPDGLLSRTQVQRLMRTLCPVSFCSCGGVRGRQEWELEWITDNMVRVVRADADL